MTGAPEPDPLRAVFLALRDALAPLGIRADNVTFALWKDAQIHGTAIFTASGEFEPGIVHRLEAAVKLMLASTPDSPPGG